MMMQKELLDRRGIGVLALGHLLTDVNQGAIPALLPFLIAQKGLSYTAASGIVMASTMLSAITQPLLGYYSDRHSLPWLIPLGMLLGGLGISLSGVATSYAWVIASVMLTGLGVAAFHPEGYRFANYVSGSQHSMGISIFTVGGSLGFALGPVMMTYSITIFGLNGTLAMAIPAVIYAILLWIELPRLILFHPNSKTTQPENLVRTDWNSFIRVTTVIVLRAAFGFGLLVFIPLYMINIRHLPIPQAAGCLTILSLSVASGTLLSSFLSERFGQKLSLLISLAVTAPLLFIFIKIEISFGIISLIAAGIAMGVSFTISVVMGQKYAEANLGVASGITTGLAIGLGGLSSPLLGMLADSKGLESVMMVLTGMPLIALVIAMTLPKVVRE